ncbi:MAG TPA: hypothetical protein VFV93_03010 [Thermomicrobiales bacterium]|nr:hypothetical protein [Thermomicrobiales bacterium]
MRERIEIGPVVRVQVQLSSLKAGPPKGRYFDPAPLQQAEWLDLTSDGATTEHGGECAIDVHNSTHPATKNRDGINPISIGFTSHYQRMRERFDTHLTNGIAGENILVETDEMITLGELADGLVIEGGDGRQIELSRVSVAHPCVEFSRFALGDRSAPPLAVSEALRFLDNGLRGFYVAVESSRPLRVAPGDRVFALRR